MFQKLLCKTDNLDKAVLESACCLQYMDGEHNMGFTENSPSVKGTVLYVAPDNLAAHLLAEPMASSCDTSQQQVCSGFFQLRDRTSHDKHVKELMKNPRLSQNYGTKGACPPSGNLKHYNVVTGCPPDILHDVLKGTVPVELSLCLSDVMPKRYFTHDMRYQAIKSTICGKFSCFSCGASCRT